MTNKHLVNKHSAELDGTSAKVPAATDLEYGEIAVNYLSGYETIAIRNSADAIVSLPVGIETTLANHIADKENPHEVTKAQVGLGNVDNTADADKPISTAMQAALDTKLDNADNGGVANNLTTNDSTIALSAAQGVALYAALQEASSGSASDLSALVARVAAVEEEITDTNDYITNYIDVRIDEIYESVEYTG